MSNVYADEELDKDLEELENTFLTFLAYDKLFGINIGNVVQIISYQPVSPIPEFPPYAIGVINLRGEVIPIIDFSMRFGREQKEYTENNSASVIADAYLKGIGRKNNKKSLLIDIEKVVMEEDIHMISKEVTQWKKQN